jgi:hypothetical protein
MRDALNRTGKPIVLSIEPFSVVPDPEQSIEVSNLWRVACDIQSKWTEIINRADISDKWSPLASVTFGRCFCTVVVRHCMAAAAI